MDDLLFVCCKNEGHLGMFLIGLTLSLAWSAYMALSYSWVYTFGTERVHWNMDTLGKVQQ